MLLLLLPPAVPPEDAEDEPDYQAPDLIDAAVSVAQEAQDMLSTANDEVKNQNEQAFFGPFA